MTIPITLFKVQVDNLLPKIPDDDNEVSTINIYHQIKQAVIDYSRLRPDSVTVDLSGDAGKYYEINATNFAGYSDAFSRIESIEYPAQAIADDMLPQYLQPADWDEDYYDGSTRYLFLPPYITRCQTSEVPRL